jgi:hypothetical protein
MGCLITDDIQFPDEPVCPPAISTPVTAPNPLNEIARWPNLADGDGGVGTPEETFAVEVWDCNVDQELTSIVVVNSQPDLPGALFGVLDPKVKIIETTDTARRSLDFTLDQVELNELGEGCHKIELFVSNGFRIASLQPIVMDDLASATWWLLIDPEGGTDHGCR